MSKSHFRNRFHGSSLAHETPAPAPKAGKSRKRVHAEAQSAPSEVLRYPPAPVRPTGRARFTVERFFEDCCEQTATMLKKAWKRGDQLVSARVPVDGLPCVLILAAYAKVYEVELVDDFDALVERYEEHVGEFSHNDKFMGSCICIVWGNTRYLPEVASFEAINIPAIYEELLP